MRTDEAWNVARRAADVAGVSVEPLTTLDDAAALGRVIDAVWGEESLPAHQIRAFQHAGGTLFGARASGRMVGFVLGFAGLEGGLHVHSHMLAVLPEVRSKGVGFALKLAQRAECLDHGIAEVRWTYDPLVARNAHFNLVRLGVVVTSWLPEFYGDMQDELNRGDRSDRFEVTWWLSSERVERALAGSAAEPAAGRSLLVVRGGTDAPEPVETGEEPAPGCTVAVPADHFALRLLDRELGRRWRAATARVFDGCFARGLAPAWITRDHRYVFGPMEGT